MLIFFKHLSLSMLISFMLIKKKSVMIRSSFDSSVLLTIHSANMILKALVCRRFFNQGFTFTLLFLFAFCFAVVLENIYSISNKFNSSLFLEFTLLIIVREGFLFTYFTWISWNQFKCDEICVKLCFMK